MLTATARTARHARFSELRMLQFCAFHWASMFEKIVQCLDERGFIGKAGTLLTIHTILEHSRCSSWHLGFAMDYMTIVNIVNLDEFG